MIIKVCGLRDADNIIAVDSLGVDLVGMIFYPRSSRYVEPATHVPATTARRVGVVVNETPEAVAALVDRYSLDYVQFHGGESRDQILAFRALCNSCGVIKAISVNTGDDVLQSHQYCDVADYLLFDTKTVGYGGSGLKFDWSVLDAYTGSTPFLVSGGIAPGDADAILAIRHQRFAGVDLNSRFEIAPAMKDIVKLRHFISQIK